MKLNLVLYIRTIFFVFTARGERLREFGLYAAYMYNHVEPEVMDGQFNYPSHPGVLKNVNMNGNILH